MRKICTCKIYHLNELFRLRCQRFLQNISLQIYIFIYYYQHLEVAISIENNLHKY